MSFDLLHVSSAKEGAGLSSAAAGRTYRLDVHALTAELNVIIQGITRAVHGEASCGSSSSSSYSSSAASGSASRIASRRGSVQTKEAARCMQELTRFFESVSERTGMHVQYTLGQHVCVNVLMLLLEHVVKPSLGQYCASAASRRARQEMYGQTISRSSAPSSSLHASGFRSRPDTNTNSVSNSNDMGNDSSHSRSFDSTARAGELLSNALPNRSSVYTNKNNIYRLSIDPVNDDPAARRVLHDIIQPYRTLMQTMHRLLPQQEPRTRTDWQIMTDALHDLCVTPYSAMTPYHSMQTRSNKADAVRARSVGYPGCRCAMRYGGESMTRMNTESMTAISPMAMQRGTELMSSAQHIYYGNRSSSSGIDSRGTHATKAVPSPTCADTNSNTCGINKSNKTGDVRTNSMPTSMRTCTMSPTRAELGAWGSTLLLSGGAGEDWVSDACVWLGYIPVGYPAIGQRFSISNLCAEECGSSHINYSSSRNGSDTRAFSAVPSCQASAMRDRSELSVAPLLYKSAAPLFTLCHHILEVLQSEELVCVVGATYAAMLTELLHWLGYSQQLSRTFMCGLCARLLTLLERVEYENESDNDMAMQGKQQVQHEQQVRRLDSGHEPYLSSSSITTHALLLSRVSVSDGVAYAALLTRLFCAPHAERIFTTFVAESGLQHRNESSSSANDRGGDVDSDMNNNDTRGRDTDVSWPWMDDVVHRLTRLVEQRHTRPTAALKFETECLCALRHLILLISPNQRADSQNTDSDTRGQQNTSTAAITTSAANNNHSSTYRCYAGDVSTSHRHITRCTPVDVIRRLLNMLTLPHTARRERWRMEVLQLTTLQLCLNFSFFLQPNIIQHARQTQSCMNKRATTGTMTPTTTDVSAAGSMPSIRLLTLLHETVKPLMLRLLTSPRASYMVLPRPALLLQCCPCAAASLHTLCEFAAVVSMLVSATQTIYVRRKAIVLQNRTNTNSSTEVAASTAANAATTTSATAIDSDGSRRTVVDIDARGEEQEEQAGRLGFPATSLSLSYSVVNDMTPDKDSIVAQLHAALESSCASARLTLAASATTAPCSSASSLASLDDAWSDVALTLLHIFAQPLTTLHYSREHCAVLIRELLLPLLQQKLNTTRIRMTKATATTSKPVVHQTAMATNNNNENSNITSNRIDNANAMTASAIPSLCDSAEDGVTTLLVAALRAVLRRCDHAVCREVGVWIAAYCGSVTRGDSLCSSLVVRYDFDLCPHHYSQVSTNHTAHMQGCSNDNDNDTYDDNGLRRNANHYTSHTDTASDTCNEYLFGLSTQAHRHLPLHPAVYELFMTTLECNVWENVGIALPPLSAHAHSSNEDEEKERCAHRMHDTSAAPVWRGMSSPRALATPSPPHYTPLSMLALLRVCHHAWMHRLYPQENTRAMKDNMYNFDSADRRSNSFDSTSHQEHECHTCRDDGNDSHAVDIVRWICVSFLSNAFASVARPSEASVPSSSRCLSTRTESALCWSSMINIADQLVWAISVHRRRWATRAEAAAQLNAAMLYHSTTDIHTRDHGAGDTLIDASEQQRATGASAAARTEDTTSRMLRTSMQTMDMYRLPALDDVRCDSVEKDWAYEERTLYRCWREAIDARHDDTPLPLLVGFVAHATCEKESVEVCAHEHASSADDDDYARVSSSSLSSSSAAAAAAGASARMCASSEAASWALLGSALRQAVCRCLSTAAPPAPLCCLQLLWLLLRLHRRRVWGVAMHPDTEHTGHTMGHNTDPDRDHVRRAGGSDCGEDEARVYAMARSTNWAVAAVWSAVRQLSDVAVVRYVVLWLLHRVTHILPQPHQDSSDNDDTITDDSNNSKHNDSAGGVVSAETDKHAGSDRRNSANTKQTSRSMDSGNADEDCLQGSRYCVDGDTLHEWMCVWHDMWCDVGDVLLALHRHTSSRHVAAWQSVCVALVRDCTARWMHLLAPPLRHVAAVTHTTHVLYTEAYAQEDMSCALDLLRALYASCWRQRCLFFLPCCCEPVMPHVVLRWVWRALQQDALLPRDAALTSAEMCVREVTSAAASCFTYTQESAYGEPRRGHEDTNRRSHSTSSGSKEDTDHTDTCPDPIGSRHAGDGHSMHIWTHNQRTHTIGNANNNNSNATRATGTGINGTERNRGGSTNYDDTDRSACPDLQPAMRVLHEWFDADKAHCAVRWGDDVTQLQPFLPHWLPCVRSLFALMSVVTSCVRDGAYLRDEKTPKQQQRSNINGIDSIRTSRTNTNDDEEAEHASVPRSSNEPLTRTDTAREGLTRCGTMAMVWLIFILLQRFRVHAWATTVHLIAHYPILHPPSWSYSHALACSAPSSALRVCETTGHRGTTTTNESDCPRGEGGGDKEATAGATVTRFGLTADDTASRHGSLDAETAAMEQIARYEVFHLLLLRRLMQHTWSAREDGISGPSSSAALWTMWCAVVSAARNSLLPLLTRAAMDWRDESPSDDAQWLDVALPTRLVVQSQSSAAAQRQRTAAAAAAPVKATAQSQSTAHALESAASLPSCHNTTLRLRRWTCAAAAMMCALCQDARASSLPSAQQDCFCVGRWATKMHACLIRARGHAERSLALLDPLRQRPTARHSSHRDGRLGGGVSASMGANCGTRDWGEDTDWLWRAKDVGHRCDAAHRTSRRWLLGETCDAGCQRSATCGRGGVAVGVLCALRRAGAASAAVGEVGGCLQNQPLWRALLLLYDKEHPSCRSSSSSSSSSSREKETDLGDDSPYAEHSGACRCDWGEAHRWAACPARQRREDVVKDWVVGGTDAEFDTRVGLSLLTRYFVPTCAALMVYSVQPRQHGGRLCMRAAADWRAWQWLLQYIRHTPMSLLLCILSTAAGTRTMNDSHTDNTAENGKPNTNTTNSNTIHSHATTTTTTNSNSNSYSNSGMVRISDTINYTFNNFVESSGINNNSTKHVMAANRRDMDHTSETTACDGKPLYPNDGGEYHDRGSNHRRSPTQRDPQSTRHSRTEDTARDAEMCATDRTPLSRLDSLDTMLILFGGELLAAVAQVKRADGARRTEAAAVLADMVMTSRAKWWSNQTATAAARRDITPTHARRGGGGGGGGGDAASASASASPLARMLASCAGDGMAALLRRLWRPLAAHLPAAENDGRRPRQVGAAPRANGVWEYLHLLTAVWMVCTDWVTPTTAPAVLRFARRVLRDRGPSRPTPRARGSGVWDDEGADAAVLRRALRNGCWLAMEEEEEEESEKERCQNKPCKEKVCDGARYFDTEDGEKDGEKDRTGGYTETRCHEPCQERKGEGLCGISSVCCDRTTTPVVGHADMPHAMHRRCAAMSNPTDAYTAASTPDRTHATTTRGAGGGNGGDGLPDSVRMSVACGTCCAYGCGDADRATDAVVRAAVQSGVLASTTQTRTGTLHARVHLCVRVVHVEEDRWTRVQRVMRAIVRRLTDRGLAHTDRGLAHTDRGLSGAVAAPRRSDHTGRCSNEEFILQPLSHRLATEMGSEDADDAWEEQRWRTATHRHACGTCVSPPLSPPPPPPPLDCTSACHVGRHGDTTGCAERDRRTGQRDGGRWHCGEWVRTMRERLRQSRRVAREGDGGAAVWLATAAALDDAREDVAAALLQHRAHVGSDVADREEYYATHENIPHPHSSHTTMGGNSHPHGKTTTNQSNPTTNHGTEKMRHVSHTNTNRVHYPVHVNHKDTNSRNGIIHGNRSYRSNHETNTRHPGAHDGGTADGADRDTIRAAVPLYRASHASPADDRQGAAHVASSPTLPLSAWLWIDCLRTLRQVHRVCSGGDGGVGGEDDNVTLRGTAAMELMRALVMCLWRAGATRALCVVLRPRATHDWSSEEDDSDAEGDEHTQPLVPCGRAAAYKEVVAVSSCRGGADPHARCLTSTQTDRIHDDSRNGTQRTSRTRDCGHRRDRHADSAREEPTKALGAVGETAPPPPPPPPPPCRAAEMVEAVLRCGYGALLRALETLACRTVDHSPYPHEPIHCDRVNGPPHARRWLGENEPGAVGVLRSWLAASTTRWHDAAILTLALQHRHRHAAPSGRWRTRNDARGRRDGLLPHAAAVCPVSFVVPVRCGAAERRGDVGRAFWSAAQAAGDDPRAALWRVALAATAGGAGGRTMVSCPPGRAAPPPPPPPPLLCDALWAELHTRRCERAFVPHFVAAMIVSYKLHHRTAALRAALSLLQPPPSVWAVCDGQTEPHGTRRRHRLAVALLPVVFLHAMHVRGAARLRRRWSALLVQHVFRRAATFRHTTRVILAALEVCRAVCMAVVRRRGLRPNDGAPHSSDEDTEEDYETPNDSKHDVIHRTSDPRRASKDSDRATRYRRKDDEEEGNPPSRPHPTYNNNINNDYNYDNDNNNDNNNNDNDNYYKEDKNNHMVPVQDNYTGVEDTTNPTVRANSVAEAERHVRSGRVPTRAGAAAIPRIVCPGIRCCPPTGDSRTDDESATQPSATARTPPPPSSPRGDDETPCGTLPWIRSVRASFWLVDINPDTVARAAHDVGAAELCALYTELSAESLGRRAGEAAAACAAAAAGAGDGAARGVSLLLPWANRDAASSFASSSSSSPASMTARRHDRAENGRRGCPSSSSSHDPHGAVVARWRACRTRATRRYAAVRRLNQCALFMYDVAEEDYHRAVPQRVGGGRCGCGPDGKPVPVGRTGLHSMPHRFRATEEEAVPGDEEPSGGGDEVCGCNRGDAASSDACDDDDDNEDDDEDDDDDDDEEEEEDGECVYVDGGAAYGAHSASTAHCPSSSFSPATAVPPPAHLETVLHRWEYPEPATGAAAHTALSRARALLQRGLLGTTATLLQSMRQELMPPPSSPTATEDAHRVLLAEALWRSSSALSCWRGAPVWRRWDDDGRRYARSFHAGLWRSVRALTRLRRLGPDERLGGGLAVPCAGRWDEDKDAHDSAGTAPDRVGRRAARLHDTDMCGRCGTGTGCRCPTSHRGETAGGGGGGVCHRLDSGQSGAKGGVCGLRGAVGEGLWEARAAVQTRLSRSNNWRTCVVACEALCAVERVGVYLAGREGQEGGDVLANRHHDTHETCHSTAAQAYCATAQANRTAAQALSACTSCRFALSHPPGCCDGPRMTPHRHHRAVEPALAWVPYPTRLVLDEVHVTLASLHRCGDCVREVVCAGAGRALRHGAPAAAQRWLTTLFGHAVWTGRATEEVGAGWQTRVVLMRAQAMYALGQTRAAVALLQRAPVEYHTPAPPHRATRWPERKRERSSGRPAVGRNDTEEATRAMTMTTTTTTTTTVVHRQQQQQHQHQQQQHQHQQQQQQQQQEEKEDMVRHVGAARDSSSSGSTPVPHTAARRTSWWQQLPRQAARSPAVVAQLVAWQSAHQRRPLAALVRDGVLAQVIAQERQGRCAFLLAHMCHGLCAELTQTLRSEAAQARERGARETARVRDALARRLAAARVEPCSAWEDVPRQKRARGRAGGAVDGGGEVEGAPARRDRRPVAYNNAIPACQEEEEDDHVNIHASGEDEHADDTDERYSTKEDLVRNNNNNNNNHNVNFNNRSNKDKMYNILEEKDVHHRRNHYPTDKRAHGVHHDDGGDGEMAMAVSCTGEATLAAQQRLLRGRLRHLDAELARETSEIRTLVMNYALYRRSALNAYALCMQLGDQTLREWDTRTARRSTVCADRHRTVSSALEPLEEREDVSERLVHAVFGFFELWLQSPDEERILAPSHDDEPVKDDASSSTTAATNHNPNNNRKISQDGNRLGGFSSMRFGTAQHRAVTARVLDRAITLTPTRQFLPLVTQLTAQLCGESEATSSRHSDLHNHGEGTRVRQLLRRLACAHPKRVIWPLLALANGNCVELPSSSSRHCDDGPHRPIASTRTAQAAAAAAAAAAKAKAAEIHPLPPPTAALPPVQPNRSVNGVYDINIDKVRAARRLVEELAYMRSIGRVVSEAMRLSAAYRELAFHRRHVAIAAAPGRVPAAAGEDAVRTAHTQFVIPSSFAICSDVRELHIPPPTLDILDEEEEDYYGAEETESSRGRSPRRSSDVGSTDFNTSHPPCQSSSSSSTPNNMYHNRATDKDTNHPSLYTDGANTRFPDDDDARRPGHHLCATAAEAVGAPSGRRPVPTVMYFEPRYRIPGGIHEPKAIRCVLSNGAIDTQLLKSHDDLRQDALIEQLFRLANRLWARAPTTARAPRLCVTTYRVVPLAPTVGVVEWICRTVALGEYIGGSLHLRPHLGDEPVTRPALLPPTPVAAVASRGQRSRGRGGGGGGGETVLSSAAGRLGGVWVHRWGAHERYFPGECSTWSCRRALAAAPRDERVATLTRLYRRYTPAMHYFFMEDDEDEMAMGAGDGHVHQRDVTEMHTDGDESIDDDDQSTDVDDESTDVDDECAEKACAERMRTKRPNTRDVHTREGCTEVLDKADTHDPVRSTTRGCGGAAVCGSCAHTTCRAMTRRLARANRARRTCLAKYARWLHVESDRVSTWPHRPPRGGPVCGVRHREEEGCRGGGGAGESATRCETGCMDTDASGDTGGSNNYYYDYSPGLVGRGGEGAMGVSVEDWYRRMTCYTHSVAVSSMLGFVVGLGDRHGGNILLHRHSAAVVHIDLGIAFEQHRLLPIPELVPFRLTRNVVDGFGVRGVDGEFRSCCAAALRVLRERRGLLMTVLQSLVHDPLAAWMVQPTSPVGHTDHNHAQNRHRCHDDGTHQTGVDEDKDEQQQQPCRGRRRRTSPADAARALARVEAKLTGLDGGEVLGVRMHVSKLIEAAQDIHNLAHIYVGWSPWL